MSYELKGIVKVIMDEQTFDSGFCKREFVVTTDEKFPQDVKFECLKDKTAILEELKVGDGLTVRFNIRGNEYNSKYYNNLVCWKVEDVTSPGTLPGMNPVTDDIKEAAEQAQIAAKNDEIPF